MIICEKNKCTGCGLCSTVCIKNSIELKKEKGGYLYPRIDNTLCTECRACRKVCPVNQEKIKVEPQAYYALTVNNISSRKKSASGGAWSAMAEKILALGGVCISAKLDDNLYCAYDLLNSSDKIDQFRDSKYVQSDLRNAYKLIEENIKLEKPILFCGCGCQIAAIRKKFGSYSNLYLCEILCHGVQSPEIFAKYINMLEERYDKKIAKFFFRDKTNGWQKSNVKIVFEDGKSEIVKRTDSEYFKFFNVLRKSCYNCHFKNYNTYSDVIIGDYWGIESFCDNFNDDSGCSLFIVNNEKGQYLFELIKDDCVVVKTTKEHAEKTHKKLLTSTLPVMYREMILKDIESAKTPKEFIRVYNFYANNNILYKILRKIKYLLRSEKND